MNKIYIVCIIITAIFIFCIGIVKFLSRKDGKIGFIELFQWSMLFSGIIIYVLMIPVLFFTIVLMVVGVFFEQANTILSYIYVVDVCLGVPSIFFSIKLEYLYWQDKNKIAKIHDNSHGR